MVTTRVYILGSFFVIGLPPPNLVGGV